MLSDALRLIRVFHDLKQQDLADRLEISKSYLSEIENGQKKDKNMKTTKQTKKATWFFMPWYQYGKGFNDLMSRTGLLFHVIVDARHT